MAWREKEYVALIIFLSLLPPVLSIFLFTWRTALHTLPSWRRTTSAIGLYLELFAAFIPPVVALAFAFLPASAKSSWFPNASLDLLIAGFLAALTAIVLLGFAKDRFRWIGMVTALLSTAILYAALLAVSL